MKKIKYCLFILFIFFISLTGAKAHTCAYKNGDIRINCNIDNSVLCSIVTDKKTNYTSGFNKLGRSNFIHEGELNCNLVPYLFVDITENMSGYTISCLGHSSASCSSQYMTFKYDSEYSNKYNEANPEPEKGENKGPNKIEGSNIGGNTANKGETISSNLDFEVTNNCDSYLGSPEDHNAPAYYLSFAFKLIKYAAILAFAALTIKDLVGIIGSQKNDSLQKSLILVIKRLVIVIIIFFIPVLVEFAFEIFGIYTDSSCVVSEVAK